jgi:glycosyltransferase involved in cell wall biosynthesis
MRLVIISKRHPSDGVVGYTRLLEHHWRSQGAQVSVIHLGATDEGQSGDHALPLLWRSSLYSLPALGATRRLRRLLQLLKPDLVHAQLALSSLDLRLPMICRDGGWPLLGTMHTGWSRHRTPFGRASRWLYRLYAPTLNRYNRLIVFGEAQRQAFLDAGVAPFRLSVLPNGVDTRWYSPMHRPPRFDDPLRVTYLGRMSREKGVQELVTAFQQAAPAHLVLTMVGDGPLRSRLQAQTAGNPAIEWRGWVRDLQAKAAIWRESDVVILPSYMEGLSFSLLEGMASGCMPVVTDVGAHREVVEGCGLVLNPLRLGSGLVEAFTWLEANHRQVGAFGLRARSRVVEGYSLDDHWEGLDGIVETLRLR